MGWDAADGTPYAASSSADVACDLDLSHLADSASPDAFARLPLPDADRLVVSPNRQVIVWAQRDVIFRRDLRKPGAQSVRPDRAGTVIERMAVADDGRVVLAAAIEGTPALWPPDSEELIPVPYVSGFVRSVALSPGGDRLAAGMQEIPTDVEGIAGAVVEPDGGPRRVVDPPSDWIQKQSAPNSRVDNKQAKTSDIAKASRDSLRFFSITHLPNVATHAPSRERRSRLNNQLEIISMF